MTWIALPGSALDQFFQARPTKAFEKTKLHASGSSTQVSIVIGCN